MIVEQYEVGNFGVFCYLIGDEESRKGCSSILRTMRRGFWQKPNLMDWIKLNISSTPILMWTISWGMRRWPRRPERRSSSMKRMQRLWFGTPSYLLEMFNATTSPPADIVVKEGDVIEAGNVRVKVIHTPGHSAGGMALYLDGRVFTGDTLFVGSVGRTDLPGELMGCDGGIYSEQALCLTRRDGGLPGS